MLPIELGDDSFRVRFQFGLARRVEQLPTYIAQGALECVHLSHGNPFAELSAQQCKSTLDTVTLKCRTVVNPDICQCGRGVGPQAAQLGQR